jgi:hypothetical protein
MRLQISDNSIYGVTTPKVSVILIDDDEKISVIRRERTKFIQGQRSQVLSVKSNETLDFVVNRRNKDISIKDTRSLSVAIVGIHDSGIQKLVVL